MENHTRQLPNKKLTDAERAELSKKLDDELEDFMMEMAAKRSAEKREKKPFDFDEWCKEIDQHPCFMTDKTNMEAALKGKYGDTLAALQALKYHEEDAEDHQFTAEKAKTDGNKHFQLKKYRWAIDCYTTGIKAKCLDKQLNGILYANRAAAHKHIGNLRSAIKDCIAARKFDPRNLKGVNRGAECLLELGYGKEAKEWIESSKKQFAFVTEVEYEGKVSDDQSKQLLSLDTNLQKATEVCEVEERNQRKKRSEEKKDFEAKSKLLKALEERKINLRPRLPFVKPELMEWGLLNVGLPQLHEHQIVSFDENGNLQWPLLLQYPQVGQIDVLTECNETTFLGELFRQVLESPAEWDINHDFQFDKVRFFIASEFDEYLIEIFEWMDFKTIISTSDFQVRQGLPVVMIFTADHVEEHFMPIEFKPNRFSVK